MQAKRLAGHVPKNPYDVVILGTGLGGTLLGAVLARHGAKVLLIDNGEHPRFAIGESTSPQTSRVMTTIGLRYDVPEILALGSFNSIKSDVATSCGVKNNFGFLYHHPGERQRPEEAIQVALPGWVGYETHLFRQDTDIFMLNACIKYGADVHQKTHVTDVDLDQDGVTVRTADGRSFRASFIADASGYQSVLANKLNLRETPCPLRLHSRSIFTHMVGVKHFEDTVRPKDLYGNPAPWSQGTLHHLFPGGWFWIIPFDNHGDSTNPLCSVGVTVDPRMYPKNRDMSPEEEFHWFVNRLPSVVEQFETARSVREWVSTERIQYSSKEVLGYRWTLLSHAAGFVDPLYSRGLTVLADNTNNLAGRLLDCIRDNDFSVSRLEYVATSLKRAVQLNDRLVNCSYVALRHFRLWSAMLRVWLLGQGWGELRFIFANRNYELTGNQKFFDDLENVPYPGLLFPIMKEYKDLWEIATETVEAFEDGKITADAAADRLWLQLQRTQFGPPFMKIADPNYRWVKVSAKEMPEGLLWLRKQPPGPLKDFHFEGMRILARTLGVGQKV